MPVEEAVAQALGLIKCGGPVHTHDCPQCKLIGTLASAKKQDEGGRSQGCLDIYESCERSYGDGPHYIIRRSSAPSDYRIRHEHLPYGDPSASQRMAEARMKVFPPADKVHTVRKLGEHLHQTANRLG